MNGQRPLTAITAVVGGRGSGVDKMRSRSEKRTDFSVAEDEVRLEEAADEI